MTIVAPPTLYNQFVLSDEEFVANFVARQEVLETLCRRLACIDPEDDGQHQILIGARGLGKTSMLRRLSIAIHSDETLSERFIPLLFREEQYNVLSLRDFWRNCGESLAEWAEKRGLNELAERLDLEVFSEAWADDESSAEMFEAKLRSLGKRAVLLVDNLDLVLGSLEERCRWSLRGRLQARGGPILIGASTQPLQESADQNAAFYEFFLPHHLEPLSLSETKKCMRSLAMQRGKAGQRVIRVLQIDPPRLRVLHRLTGGNPRALALSYRLLETEDLPNAMADLERLLDEVTPYYKALVEEYKTRQQQAVINAIALHWDPVTTGKLSQITDLPTTTLSPQVIRMRKEGLIEITETSGSYSGHQIVERFFNIWYLMRHGTRRTKQRMRWLVAFLSNFYTRDQLIEIDHEARDSGRFKDWTNDYALAFEQAIQEARRFEVEPLELRATILCAAVGEARRFEAEAPVTSDATEALAMVYEGFTLDQGGDTAAALEAYDAVIARFGDSDDAQLQVQTAMAMVNKGSALGQGGDTAAELEAFDAVIARFGDSDDAQLQVRVARAMVNKGNALGQGGDTTAALEAYDAVIARFGDSDDAQLQVQTAMAMVNKGSALGQGGDTAAALEAYDAVIARFGDSDDAQLQVRIAMAMVNKGNALGQGGDTAAALEAYDAVIARFGDSDDVQLQEATARAMVNKGSALGQGGDTAAELEAYDAVIARFGDSDDAQLQVRVARAMVNKGNALGQGGDTTAALEAYDAVIARFGDSDDAQLQVQTAMAMVNKGSALGQGGDTAAALEAYDAVIARFGDSDDAQLQVRIAMAMVNKGNALGQGGDTAAALEASDAVIARFGDSDDVQLQEATARAMVNKGSVLGQGGETTAALEASDAVIARFGDSDDAQLQEATAMAMVNKGNALGQGGDTTAALEAYDAVIARIGDSDDVQLQKATAMAMVNKGGTLGQDGDTTAALEASDAVIARFGDSDDAQLQEHVVDALIVKGHLLPESAAQLTHFEKALDLSQRTNFQQSFPENLAKVRLLVANALIACRTDPHRAEELLLAAKKYQKKIACTSLFWFYLSKNRLSYAEENLKKIDIISSQVRALMEAGLALQAENFGEATNILKAALATGQSPEDFDLTDDLERLVRLAIANGFGEWLIKWFDRTNFSDRYAPIYVALKAAVLGEKLLLDVNPEMREAAQVIMKRVDSGSV